MSLPFSHNELLDVASLPVDFLSTTNNDAWPLTPQSIAIHDIHMQQPLLPQIPSFSDSSFWAPIKLSTLAGLSTCIGASVAFLVSADDNGGTAKANKDRQDNARVGVGPDLLAFSLALAGSVMITVTLVSIIPEALSINAQSSSSGTWSIFGHFISSQLILQRAVGFAVGWGLYALLSQWLALLPEEDEWSDLLVGDDDITFAQAANNFGFALADPTSKNVITSSLKPSRGDADTNRENRKQSSWRLTILLFLSLLIHNFPEGLAVAFSAASSTATYVPPPSSVVIKAPATASIIVPSTIKPISSGANSFSSNLNPNESPVPHPVVTSSIVLPSPSTQPASIQTQSISPASSPSSLASIVALSIALHNIPEGIAIAIPCMAARPGQPFLAFGLASLSGLAEPVGAFIGLIILRLRGLHAMEDGNFAHNADDNIETIVLSNGQDMGDALAFVAGIMMAVAICELLPEASRQRKECGTPDSFILGIVTGVGVMLLTELYLGA
ncbi:hypothetical protein ACHAXR_004439 [Thalassiosira sp. AJA248-18]